MFRISGLAFSICLIAPGPLFSEFCEGTTTGHRLHGLAPEESPKHEYLSSKQIPSSNLQMLQTATARPDAVWDLGHWDFELVSDLELRISDLVAAGGRAVLERWGGEIGCHKGHKGHKLSDLAPIGLAAALGPRVVPPELPEVNN